MVRVTNNIVAMRTINQIQRSYSKLADTQEKLSSGRRINRPSDDPIGVTRALRYRSSIDELNQFSDNIDEAKTWLLGTETELRSVTDLMLRVKQLALESSSDSSDANSRLANAEEIDRILEQMVQISNKRQGGKYIFSGTETLTKAFEAVKIGGRISEVRYLGNDGEIDVEFAKGQIAPINLNGRDIFQNNISEVSGSDLDPDLGLSTLLSDLNNGNGVAPGQISIQDSNGSTEIFDLSGAVTVGDVVSIIASGTIVDFNASIGTNNNLYFEDNLYTGSTDIVISDIGGGTTAADLGIVKVSADLEVFGDPLSSNISRSTELGLINAGAGLSGTDITIVNGERAVVLDLSSATTIGDAIDMINDADIGITASINANGDGLNIETDTSATDLVISGAGATSLGIEADMEGTDVFALMIRLRDAMLNNERDEIATLEVLLNDGRKDVLGNVAVLGAEYNRMDLTQIRIEDNIVFTTELLSNNEDVDIAEYFTRFSIEETAYQSALATAARIIQPTLLNFLN
jgi:flagellar hook-associated protein 3 FlgL